MEREAFLERVSSALPHGDIPKPPAVPAELPDLGPVDLVALFRTRAQSVNVVVHGPVPKYSAPRTVNAIAAGHNIESFVAWEELPASGISSSLAAQGYARIDADVPLDQHGRLLEIARADLGVTGADFALAESGSVVLIHGPGKGRVVSLIPPIHVALVRVDAIHRTLSEWARDFPGLPMDTANLVVVTGPSRTGDIELELSLGVHGPRHMHIVLIR